MIDDGKITTYSDRRKESMDDVFGVFPWEIHQHTPMDVERAVSPFTRLLDAIEIGLPSSSTHDCGCEQPSFSFEGINLPYSESVIEASFTQVDSFTGHFLSALPVRQLNFRYIAPGIRLQDPVEFTNQPLAERRYNRLFPEHFSTDQPTPFFLYFYFEGAGERVTLESALVS